MKFVVVVVCNIRLQVITWVCYCCSYWINGLLELKITPRKGKVFPVSYPMLYLAGWTMQERTKCTWWARVRNRLLPMLQEECVSKMQLACMQKEKSIPGSPAISAEEGCCHTPVKTACAPVDSGQTLISELICLTLHLNISNFHLFTFC